MQRARELPSERASSVRACSALAPPPPLRQSLLSASLALSRFSISAIKSEVTRYWSGVTCTAGGPLRPCRWLGSRTLAAQAHLVGVVHADGQVLGHAAGPDGVQHGLLQAPAEGGQRLIVVQLGPEGQAPRPALPTGGSGLRVRGSPCMQGAPCPAQPAWLVPLWAAPCQTCWPQAGPRRAMQPLSPQALDSDLCPECSWCLPQAHAGSCPGRAPGKDAGHRVGGRGVALLVLPPVPRHRACTTAGHTGRCLPHCSSRLLARRSAAADGRVSRARLLQLPAPAGGQVGRRVLLAATTRNAHRAVVHSPF